MIWRGPRGELVGRDPWSNSARLYLLVVLWYHRSFGRCIRIIECPAMAINERGIVVALLAWCSLAVAAPTEARADAYSRPDILQLAQAEGCPSGGKTSVVFYRYVGAGEAKAI